MTVFSRSVPKFSDQRVVNCRGPEDAFGVGRTPEIHVNVVVNVIVSVVTSEALDVSTAGTASTANTARDAEQRLVLKLFICGASPRAETAVANLRHICDNDLKGDYSLEVIDVLEQPDLAEEAKVLATPTLIKLRPLPLRRIIGDLSDREKLLVGLEVARRAVRANLPPPHSAI